ncbi:hypothetical protein FM113_01420 [Leucobacter sp. 7(1)]|nr:hypothetical protein FM113_01420 [Leucobacter sp. 7(1)]
MSFHPHMQGATLSDITPEAYGRISKRTAQLTDVDVTQVTFHAGAKWSEDLREAARTELCELPHVALVTAGTLGVVMRDGAYQEFSAGDAMLLPPGHDAWAVGESDCTFVEFSRGNEYYAQ